MKTLKTIIKITYFPMLAWMIYAFFNPDTVSYEVVIGFIIYSFIILPWLAGNSAESYDWEDDDRRYRDDYSHSSSKLYDVHDDNDIYYNPQYFHLEENIYH